MTYCVAMSLNAGMIFASDSRTNAGVDQIARFSKMKVFARDGDRVIVTLSSGNLAVTQSALNNLDRQLDLERDLQAEAAGTRDHAEGLRAFLEKRPPAFGGGQT